MAVANDGVCELRYGKPSCRIGSAARANHEKAAVCRPKLHREGDLPRRDDGFFDDTGYLEALQAVRFTSMSEERREIRGRDEWVPVPEEVVVAAIEDGGLLVVSGGKEIEVKDEVASRFFKESRRLHRRLSCRWARRRGLLSGCRRRRDLRYSLWVTEEIGDVHGGVDPTVESSADLNEPPICGLADDGIAYQGGNSGNYVVVYPRTVANDHCFIDEQARLGCPACRLCTRR